MMSITVVFCFTNNAEQAMVQNIFVWLDKTFSTVQTLSILPTPALVKMGWLLLLKLQTNVSTLFQSTRTSLEIGGRLAQPFWNLLTMPLDAPLMQERK